MATMDEYVDQLLAEKAHENLALHHVVQNILDQHIPDNVKGRLLNLSPYNLGIIDLPPHHAKRKPSKERQS